MADSTIAGLTSGTPTTDDLLVFYDNADGVTKKTPISSLPSGGSGDMLKANYDPANINQQVVGTTATQTLTNKTLTAPRFADLGFIADQNGNEMLAFNSNASAVNYIELENNVTGSAVHIRAKGDDANVGLHLVAKGATGYVNITDSTDETKRVRFDPSTNTTGITTTVRTNSTTARTIDLPNATDTLVGRATTDTLTNKTISGASNTLTVDGTTSVGFLSIPQNSQSAAYTLVLTDAGKHIYHPSADTTARTWTIPANSSVAFPIGTAITFINDTSAGTITISITTDTLVLAGAGTTGSRTLTANGIATATKVTSTRWIISGVNLT